MKKDPSVAPELIEVSKELLGRAGADLSAPARTLEATQELLERFRLELRLRIGEDAFRSLLELAHRRAVREHPSLESVSLGSDLNLLIWNPVDPSSQPGAELCEGLVWFVAESLAIIRRLGRDQDWDQVGLWPVLRELDRRGLPIRPESTTDGQE